MSSQRGETLLPAESHSEDEIVKDSGSEVEFETDAEEPYNSSHAPDDIDRKVLEDAEEEENLLQKPGRFDRVKKKLSKSRIGRRAKNNGQRGRRLKQEAEGSSNASLLYEMEGGYKDTSSRSSSQSVTLLNEKWNQEPASGKSAWKIVLIAATIAIIFLLLSYGSYRASQHTTIDRTFSNGTHIFGPTTILISLDGFRADFLQRGLTPAMKAFIKSGVSPEYMLPSFPSLTFPNHFTLVTGLYPESHGIVSNQFWDPKMQEEFYYTNISNSMQPKWWNAEPIWVTAEKARLKTAIHMWPGSEAHIGQRDPTYLDKYNGTEALDVKVERVLQWLDMPLEERPQLIGAYVPNVDSDGHKYGPNSTEIRATIVEVDSMLTKLIEGLLERNLTEVVNVVIVSDHGMATTSNDRLIQLEDFIDISLIDHIDGWPLRGLRLKNPSRDVPILHQQLLAASKNNAFDVYTLDTMPEKYHFRNNDRIAPLWVVPHVGWAVVEKVDFDVIEAKATGKQYHPLGLHGYDHEHPLMRAIFIARGPAFPHEPNSRVAAFQNIEVYNIVCDSLGIQPVPNNGTLRLPLTTQGLHNDPEEPSVPLDPVPSSTQQHSFSTSTGQSSTPTTQISTSSVHPTTEPTAGTEPNPPETGKKHDSWWDFLHNQIESAKEWAKELIDSIRNNKPPQRYRLV